ncbi:MAG: DUF928 domain-containing protein, partial [Phormidesmis sp. RL_2_1]|nr:DUF928 domain-containing protein [Phormidesmis sp. RL_2_1]
ARQTGGASRGNFFTPPADNSAPRSATGGASRGSFFIPPADDNTAPQGSTGGASRGLDSASSDWADEAVVNTSDTARSNIYGVTEAATLISAAASMLAVMPESFYGTTLEARPTILVYVPASTADTAVFSLKQKLRTRCIRWRSRSLPQAVWWP